MSSSLLFGATELLPADPTAVGVHLLAGHDLGDAQATAVEVAALLLDGEPVLSRHATNRQILLPLLVRGSTRDDLTARVDVLLQDIAKPANTVTWTPDAGLPLVWDTFVGQPTLHWSLRTEDQFVQQIDVALPALPFGRSDALEAVTVATVSSATRGRLYGLTAIKGSARTPVAASIEFPAAVSSWLVHHPPSDADPAAPILADVSAGTVTLTGAEKLRGTYSVVVGLSSYTGAAGAQQIMTVAASQSGTGVTQTIDRAYTVPSNLRPLVVGNLTLPLVDRPAGATASLTLTFADTGGAVVQTIMLLDSRGQTVMSFAQPTSVANTVKAWIDEPAPSAATGNVYNSPSTTRTAGYAVAEPRIAGGPLAVTPDDEGSALLVYAPEQLPSTVTVSHAPRWLAERVA